MYRINAVPFRRVVSPQILWLLLNQISASSGLMQLTEYQQPQLTLTIKVTYGHLHSFELFLKKASTNIILE